MAACSGGVEWTTIIKPILAASYGPFNKTDILNFVKGIIKSESELLSHDAEYEAFYTAFSSLASEYISSCAESLEKSQIGPVCDATRILLDYLVNRLCVLLNENPTLDPGTQQQSGTVSGPQLSRVLLLCIQGLCQGRSTLSCADRLALTSDMKVAKLPTHVKTSTPEERSSPTPDLKRPRSDLTASILEQLMTPLCPSPPSNAPIAETVSTETPTTNNNRGSTNETPQNKLTDTEMEIKNQFIKKNIQSLKALNAGDKIIEICLNLTHLSPYINKCKEDNSKHGICSSQAEATQIKQSFQTVLTDISFVTGALGLPVLEPLSEKRIQNLTLIGRGCLSAAVSASTAVVILTSSNPTATKSTPGSASNQNRSPVEEEVDQTVISLVEKSIEVFTSISNTISNSKHVEKHIIQNHQMLGTSMLLQGLWYQLSSHCEKSKDEKGKSPSRNRDGSSRINLQKIQQGFSVLSVALATQALQLSSVLMADLEDETNNQSEIPSRVDLFGKYTPSQRVAFLLAAAPIHQLLHYLAIISYRKAYTLKRVLKPATEEDTVSFSDSTIYNGDDFSFSDDSSGDDDEDSEPILGLWLEKTLAPKVVPEGSEIDSERDDKPCQPSTATQSGQLQSNQSQYQSGGIVPEKGEPHGYIILSTEIFSFLNTYFLSSSHTLVKTSIISNIGEQHMVILAAIIRDLDRETARTKTGTISTYFGLALGALYFKFSHFLTLYTHNLLATSVLTDTLQTSLLSHLGVNPTPQDQPWPLQVYPRTLVVLSQIIALKKPPEQEALILRLWNRVTMTITDSITNPPTTFEMENEDLNVEHAQLLLFFFHSLSLLQKKSVLLTVSKALIQCGDTIKATTILKESQLLHTARLLHIFEHLMRHLYDAPSVLLEQVKWNLFSATSLVANDNSGKGIKMASRMYCPSQDVVDNMSKPSSQEESGMKPKFYSLTAVEMNHEETPKLDGLACNFILATPEKLKYPSLIDALIDILGALNQCDGNWLKKGQAPNVSMLCAIQYCFASCWRMLLLLPPSSSFISQLGVNSETKDAPLLLYSLIWGPRTGCNVFSGYMKDNLVKQAMFTSNAETLLKTISSTMTSLHYTATLARNVIANFKTKYLTNVNNLQLADVIILDVVIAKLLVHLNDQKSAQSGPTLETAISLLPEILQVFNFVAQSTRSGLIAFIEESNTETTPESQTALLEVLAIVSSQNTHTSTLTASLRGLLPANVRSNLERWNSTKASFVPSSVYSNDQIPSESHILSVLNNHILKLYRSDVFICNESLKHLMHALVNFTGELLAKLAEEDAALKQQIVTSLLPVSLDACAEYLHDVVNQMILDPTNEEQQKEIYCEMLKHCYNLLTKPQPSNITDKTFQECLKIMESLLDSTSGCSALKSFFTTESSEGTKPDLIKILLSVSKIKPQPNQNYSSCVHKFFNKLFSTAEKSSGGNLEVLCIASLSSLANVDRKELCDWLRYLLLGQFDLDSPEIGPEDMDLTCATEPTTPSLFENSALLNENQQLLRSLTSYVVKDNQEAIATSILEALIPIGSRLLSLDLAGTGFCDVMQILVTLANSGSRKGHTHLFCAATLWLEQCKEYILETRTLQQIEQEGCLQGRCLDVVEAAGQLLGYVADIVAALGPAHSLSTPGAERAQSPSTWEGAGSGDLSPDAGLFDCDWMDDLMEQDDESGGEDSDEDSLCNKLCTFTMTQKEFMNQHWYHCHTCKMVDGVGVCSICARVCHKSHDVTYAKYGNFFCDCGAKEDSSCQALVKRSPLSADAPPLPLSSSNVEHMLQSSLRRTPSSPMTDKVDKVRDEKSKQRTALAKQLESCSEALMHHAAASPIVSSLLELSCLLLNAVKSSCERNSSVGCHLRAQKALQQLHESNKQFESTDQLMVPTLGSQEGAFENVRSNYPGDQGQTIRQLLSAHMIRRVAMCCLSTPQGKRQHLAVSHEKGKITVLQLSALLKQADSSKRKLTLTRLASAPIPFTVLSITGNPCNEDFLAVCGLKDCHVLTFSSGGTVVQHLVLHPQLETGNYIIRAIWLPGSQTKLALITADFVKIYDLSKDALSPQYYFLVPSGKIRDATFVFPEEGEPSLLVMSSAGYIYSQTMCEESSAEHGPFYVTNTLDVNHPEIKDVSGLVAGGGVSLYYSHTLQLLFFSFSQGKSFIAPLKCLDTFELATVFQIQLSSKTTSSSSNSNSSKSSSQSQQPQPLCQWSEVPNHPGLVCSVLQASNNPVILMVKPDTIMVQEIKVVPAKARTMDMVAIRHSSSNCELRTTLILLCEDGSLRIYMANQDQTGYWLSPSMQATNPLSLSSRSGKKKKVAKSSKQSGPSSAPIFPVDYFEHCQLMADIEYGGNDVLEVYNTDQIKGRLTKLGQYIVNTRPAGFSLELNNSDPSLVITGVRIFVGSQDPLRSPTFLEILGRSIQLNVTSSRWFDYPLTREESLQADRKLIVTFGPSQDPDYVTMVDSVLVYGKTKESFGWPEESEEVPSSSAATATSSTSDSDSSNSSQPLTSLDKVMAGILEVLDGCFTLFELSDDKQQQQKSLAIDVATKMLTLPTPNSIQNHSKSLLAALHPSRASYHQFKDQAILKYVTEILSELDKVTETRDLDAESFYRIVLMTRSIAAVRPHNLVKILDSLYKNKEKHFMVHLLDNFWRLHDAKPVNLSLAPVCVPGLSHVETTVHAIVEVSHAFTTCDLDLVPQAAQLYLKLLLSNDTGVSFSAKQAMIRVLRPRQRNRRRVFIPSPPHCISPNEPKPAVVAQPSQESHPEPVDAVEPIGMLEEGAAAVANPIEALLGVGAGAFPPLLDIPPDAVDETMVELAIALSLQEHDSVANLLSVQQNIQQGLQNLSGQALQSLQALATQAQPGPSQPGNFSDTTASAGGSDDEGSTAATDGSTLRTSPAEQGGSESGGSGAESINFEHYTLGRTSSFGDNTTETTGAAKSEASSVGPVVTFQTAHEDQETENCTRFNELRSLLVERLLLEKLLEFLPKLKEVGGVQAIPFLQVILILTSDLDGEDQRDRHCLEGLLSAIISELGMKNQVDVKTASECNRSPRLEVHLVMMRFLSVLMSRTKSTSKPSNTSDYFVSHTTASTLMDNSVIEFCLGLLQGLLLYWKKQNSSGTENSGNTSGALGGSLLRSQPNLPPPDMSPFFLKLYVKGLPGGDVFDSYPQLLTEMALRLPYQVLKHADNPLSTISDVFGDQWNYYLCEYMMTNQTPFVRRQVRKLLMFLCGSKDKYRKSRDFHALEYHTKEIIKRCQEAGLDPENFIPINLAYDQLVELMEHLKACLEIATSRPNNWQNFCMISENLIPFLFQASCVLDEGVCPTILQLLQNAIGKCQQSAKERAKSVESDVDDKVDCSVLVGYINQNVSQDVLALFIRTFLLETNSTSVRWQAHDLIQSLQLNSSQEVQENLKDLLWTFWSQVGTYGRKAAQFVDLLGYFSMQSAQNNGKLQDMVDMAVNSLKAQNQVLAQHPNTNLYSKLSQFIELDGFYFESRSCLVCNNPEVPLSSIKLTAIKVDSKFTTTTQIVKLVGSHSISRISLRIGDLKRAKMVRSINIFYNNRSVQAVVELKNKPSLWNKAKKVTLTSGQTEVKVDFPLPIVACNLMIEYTDFYENIQASTETLQCPRCGVSVPANPGVCGNCGENVFQCHKCRAINYDEKDPFLCHSCGFCKYAKFEYTLTAKPCCAVDPIENDEDRRKTLSGISSMQERADRIYKQLNTIRPNVEGILQSIEEGQVNHEDINSSSTSSTHVKQRINLLAQRYCVDCKSSFEELGKISQKVMACRHEIVTYDRKQREDLQVSKPNRILTVSSKGCYGCASATSEHCLTLLRALATISGPKQVLCCSGLITELVEKNLHRKSLSVQDQVRQLLCLLARDQPKATEELCQLIMTRVTGALKTHKTSSYHSFSVHPEMALLSAMISTEDSCWEQKLKCVLRLYLMACNESGSPSVTEAIVLPCLRILIGLMNPPTPTSQANKDKTVEDLVKILPTEEHRLDVNKWLNNDTKYSFKSWIQRMPLKPEEKTSDAKPSREETRAKYLSLKYLRLWKSRSGQETPRLKLSQHSWLKHILFNKSSRIARQSACKMLETLFHCQVPQQKQELLNLLTGFLDELGTAGETSAEFLVLYRTLIQSENWKRYLALKGTLVKLADLITKEIEQLHQLEDSSLVSDLAEGFALKMLTELLSCFLDHEAIKRLYKGRLVGAVLNGYLALRRLAIQRTRLIDETQEKLFELLEEMTSGTETETKDFMKICMDAVEKCDVEDDLTPVFILERLCTIISPEENDIGEFFLTLEKDPQQEDFLQGRMLGNPYSSTELGLGPLMRDVKNKICQDCELVALLEDDNGMELLVANKIISLDLPVREVYKKVWLTEGEGGEAMRVVYRMRGLLGDATEEFVETLDNKSKERVDNEEVYKMANVMTDCKGLQIMLQRLSGVTNVVRGKPLLQVLLRLLLLCTKVRSNQEQLARPDLGAIGVLLSTAQRCLAAGKQADQRLTEQILDILETVLTMAAARPLDDFLELSKTFGGPEHIQALLACASPPPGGSSVSASLLQPLGKVLAALTYGRADRMDLVTSHFAPVLDFERYDTSARTSEDEQKMELFCLLAAGIERSEAGNTLKQHIHSLGIVKRAAEYISAHAPPTTPLLLVPGNDEWKDFIARPALKVILRFLAGLATEHEPTQLEVSTPECIAVLHRLEQVSSEEHVGSLSENLLEALRTNPAVAARVEQVRQQTRAEKKRLAMAMREKQLGALGMKANEKGQVVAKSQLMTQLEELGEETGLTCVICREGYRCQPAKVLGIYTYTKRCTLDEEERKQRRTMGYSTVTHFNVVHVDCHMAAVRQARARDEWESAALQNANTKCNGLLPLWGPSVPESAFASCLARHNTYLQECTGHRDIGYGSTVHDLKLLLLRFAQEKPFNEDAGGGGPESNMHLLGYLVHMALYVLNTTRSAQREDKSLASYLSAGTETWVSSSFVPEGPLYWAAMSLLLRPTSKWQSGERLSHLRRLLVLAHARHTEKLASGAQLPSKPPTKLSDITPQEYNVYKPYLIYFGLVDGICRLFFKKVTHTGDDQWPSSLADYIRHNDEALLRASDQLLAFYTEELLPCASFDEFCDVLGLLGEVDDPNTFLTDLLRGFGTG